MRIEEANVIRTQCEQLARYSHLWKCKYVNTNDLSNVQVMIKINVELNKSHFAMKTLLQIVSIKVIKILLREKSNKQTSGLVVIWWQRCSIFIVILHLPPSPNLSLFFLMNLILLWLTLLPHLMNSSSLATFTSILILTQITLPLSFSLFSHRLT